MVVEGGGVGFIAGSGVAPEVAVGGAAVDSLLVAGVMIPQPVPRVTNAKKHAASMRTRRIRHLSPVSGMLPLLRPSLGNS